MFLQGWILGEWFVMKERAPSQSPSHSCSCHASSNYVTAKGTLTRATAALPNLPKPFLHTLPSLMYSVVATEDRQLQSLDGVISWECCR